MCGLLCDWTFLKLQLKVYSCSLQKYAVQLVEPAYSPFAELKFKYCAIGLSFVPTVISILDFPINLQNKQMFSDEICGTEDVFLSLPRERFQTFLRKSPSFLLNQDIINSSSFEVNFIHKTLKSFQKVKAQQIIKIAQSGTFLLSCFLAVIVFCTCLSICFCPVLFVSMLK